MSTSEVKKYIDTNGMNADLYASLKLNCPSVVLCGYCQKYYMSDMVIKTYDAEDDDDLSVCWHCYFWMNYDKSMRSVCDGFKGVKIVDYILKCSPDHIPDKCKRHTIKGGCFLCEHLSGIKIEDIKDSDKLYSSKNDEIVISDILDDECDTTKIITVNI